ncbi:MAG: methyltransferase domain-containing protein [Chloroflexi bacterium]|nr:methyltransferase domain-containing protein [Chloroflexota bacterium]
MKEQKTPKIPPAFVVKLLQSVQTSILSFANRLSPPFAQVLTLAGGAWTSQIIYAAAKLGIADLLGNGPKSADALAKESGSNPEAIYRLLRALASVGIFKETSDRMFKLTPLAETLQKNHPMSVQPAALLIGDPIWREPWVNIIHSIKTGEEAFENVFKKSYFEYLNEHADTWETFNNWMTRESNMNCPIIAASYPFSKFRKVVDVGGGHGSLLAHILRKYPTVNGVLFDLPDVVKGATEINSAIASRCQMVGGDFFKAVPEGADLYIMQQIVHDWSDELATKILTNCKNVMADDGRLLVVDAVIKPGNSQDMNKFIDLQMLLITKGGRERTEQEFKKLFHDAGLELLRIIPTASMFSIIEGQKS